MDGIKSKTRVQKYGEVFTPDSIVCDMLDGVVKNLYSKGGYTDNNFTDETFLEPTCGDGQFLIRILDEKLKRVNRVPLEQRELALVKAVSTIYGIDIQKDNVEEAQARLENYLFNNVVDTFDVGGKGECRPFTFLEGVELTDKLKSCLSNIIHNNIIVGDMLSEETKIIFYNWGIDWVTLGIIPLNDLQNQEYLQDTEELDTVDYLNIFNAWNKLEETKDIDKIENEKSREAIKKENEEQEKLQKEYDKNIKETNKKIAEADKAAFLAFGANTESSDDSFNFD